MIDSEYEARDYLIDLRTAESVLGVSIATMRQWIASGTMHVETNEQVRITEIERLCDTAQIRTPRHLARAYSVLPRWQTVFTTGDIAGIIQCSRDVVTRLIDQGHVRGYRLQSGLRRVTRRELAEYLAKYPGPLAADMGMFQAVKPGSKPKPRKGAQRSKQS